MHDQAINIIELYMSSVVIANACCMQITYILYREASQLRGLLNYARDIAITLHFVLNTPNHLYVHVYRF